MISQVRLACVACSCLNNMQMAELSKEAGCRRKSLPTWLGIGHVLCLAFLYGWRFLNKLFLDWPLTLTTQLSTSKRSDNPEMSTKSPRSPLPLQLYPILCAFTVRSMFTMCLVGHASDVCCSNWPFKYVKHYTSPT